MTCPEPGCDYPAGAVCTMHTCPGRLRDTIPACSSPLRAVGASVAHFGLSGDATLAADLLSHATTNNQNEVQNNG